MGERQQRPEEMATTSTAVTTVPAQLQEEPTERVLELTLRPTATAAASHSRKKVMWTDDTVDNEGMDKKKSKCCCIYQKPRQFGESDSEESEDECDHCAGHVERRRMKHVAATQPTQADVQEGPSDEKQPAPAPAPPDRDGVLNPHS